MWSVQDVEQAARRIAPYIVRTPLIEAQDLSNKGMPLYVKVESVQKTGSFKVRGALNALLSLSEEQKKRGVVTASSGSHGKAVAYAARVLGVSAVVVLPQNPVEIKKKAIEQCGATIVNEPGPWAHQLARARAIGEAEGRTLIHSFDAPEIFLGQGTVGLEILADLADVQTVIVPVGGGGLISGILLALKQTAPHVRVIGVQPTGCAAVYESWKTGQIVPWPTCDTIAEGLTCTQPEANTLGIIGRFLDDMVIVTDEEIKAALAALLVHGKILVETSGAAATAAYLFDKVPLQPGKTVVIASGGNIAPALVTEILSQYGDQVNSQLIRENGKWRDRDEAH